MLIKVIHYIKLKTYFRTFDGRYNDLLQHYNTPLFTICMWPSPLLMCVTYIGFDLTGYDWLYSWFHGGCLATTGEVYSSYALIQKIWFSELVWLPRCLTHHSRLKFVLCSLFIIIMAYWMRSRLVWSSHPWSFWNL